MLNSYVASVRRFFFSSKSLKIGFFSKIIYFLAYNIFKYLKYKDVTCERDERTNICFIPYFYEKLWFF